MSLKSSLHLLTFLLLSSWILPTAAESSEEAPPCMRIVRNCRLRTERTTVQNDHFVTMNISCFCEDDEPEDMLEHLEALSSMTCSWLPLEDSSPNVNFSSIHITGCLVQQKVFPISIINLARRTNHMEIVMHKCPMVRLEGITHAQKHVPSMNVSVTESTLSGLPRGLLSNTTKLHLRIKDSKIPVIESKAITGFEDDTEVRIEIINSSISTVKMVAFELPAIGSLSIKGGEVLTLDQLAYSGGTEVTLEEVKIGRFLGRALNLDGVRSFRMTSCTVAELYANAVVDHNNGRDARDSPSSSQRSAVIEYNKVISVNGDAFVHLCKFSSLVWSYNTFLNISEPPLRLQDDNCPTKRNWKETIRSTGLKCENCQSFANPNEQSCAIYQTAFCTLGIGGDQHNAPLLRYVIEEGCINTHPDIASSLRDVCRYDPNAPQKAPRSYNGGCLITENPFVLAIAIILTIIRMY